MASQCEVSVSRAGAAAVLTIRGEVAGEAAGVLSRAYEQAVSGHPPGRVVLDFAGVDYINSAGIAVIVSLLDRARSQRRQLVACGLSGHYRQIFEITRLADFIRLEPDLEPATTATAPAAAGAPVNGSRCAAHGMSGGGTDENA
ncbi:MAG: STAS domain-containing protein [Streptosporangiaceae bacterium]